MLELSSEVCAPKLCTELLRALSALLAQPGRLPASELAVLLGALLDQPGLFSTAGTHPG